MCVCVFERQKEKERVGNISTDKLKVMTSEQKKVTIELSTLICKSKS